MATSSDLRVFPLWSQPLFRPARYKAAHGGRGSGKSWQFARALLLRGWERQQRFLCGRELQVSIQESVHQLLSDQIVELGLQHFYDVQNTSIFGNNGTEFIFSGIRQNITKIKSMEGIDVCWLEEAEKISKRSWEVLIPTIRKEGSEIWVTYNPDEESDPTSQMFQQRAKETEEEYRERLRDMDAVVMVVNWRDNPWFPESLRREKDRLHRVDPDAAAHVWEGGYQKASAAQILRGKYIVQHFEPQPEWLGPYYGADWGFSNDPDTLIRMWISETPKKRDGQPYLERRLMIEYEAYEVGCSLNNIPKLWDTVPGARHHVIRADNARPETIHHVGELGFNCIAAEKWAGSVEDGIAYLRGFDIIVIHPRCKHTAEEARLYKYKVDKITGDVTSDIVDAHNHCIDAIRYGLDPAIRMYNVEDVVTEEEVQIDEELDDIEMRLNNFI